MTKPSRSSAPDLKALRLFKEAAVRVPAYKDFLRKAKIKPDSIRTPKDLSQVPPTDKPNYIYAYPLHALAWDGTLEKTRYVSASSGSTGTPTYWPRGEEQNIATGEIFRRIFEDIFQTKKGTHLFCDLFGLGPWIAGFEFYNAAKYTAQAGNNIAIATPSFEKRAALDTVRRLGPSFSSVLLAGYPPFIKDILESGTAEGLDWQKMQVHLFTGGEAFSELWRNRVLAMIGKKDSLTHLINLYGMAETGVVAHETPFSITLRRAVSKIPAFSERLSYEGMAAALYQYNPLARYLEVGEDNTLILSAYSGLPLIRYNTRDQGGLLGYEEAANTLAKHRIKIPKPTTKWTMPLVYLYGRRDLSLSFFALNIYVENIKYCLESAPHAHKLSGLFIMRVGQTKALDQRFEVVVELGRGVRTTAFDARQLSDHVARALCTVNSEYAKTCSLLGKRAHPLITLLPYGKIETVPGKKHRWVKR